MIDTSCPHFLLTKTEMESRIKEAKPTGQRLYSYKVTMPSISTQPLLPGILALTGPRLNIPNIFVLIMIPELGISPAYSQV